MDNRFKIVEKPTTGDPAMDAHIEKIVDGVMDRLAPIARQMLVEAFRDNMEWESVEQPTRARDEDCN